MSVNFKINDENYEVDVLKFPADMPLITFLREQAQLTATKYMCLEGGCGACVCAITEKHPVTGEVQTKAANSCLMLLNTCMDREIITSEGIGNNLIGYHPIQERMAKMHGTQCGFCTPGFVMNMWALLESKGGTLSLQDVESSFGGNICRCTGYRPILDAMKSFATNSETKVPEEICDIEDFEWISAKTCPKTGLKCSSGDGSGCKPSLMQRVQYPNGRSWYWPRNLVELFQALEIVGSNKYMLVAGNTAHGVYRRDEDIMDFIEVGNVVELKKYWLDGVLSLGANITLTEAIDIFGQFKTRPGFEYLEQLAKHFDKIANIPVRNWGTLAGNITIKKEHPEFPSDVFITFETLDVMVVISDSPTTQHRMPLIQYIRTATPKAVITTFELKPYPRTRYVFNSHKITPRAQNAHAYVNAGFLLEMNTTTGNVNSARICFGNIRSDFTHAANVENFLPGKNLYDREVLAKTFQLLAAAINPEAVLPEPSPAYRRLLSCGLFYKFVLFTAPADKVKSQYRSGGFSLVRQLSSGVQRFETDPTTYPVTQPVQKVEAMIQTTGEALYMNDVPITNNSVYCAFATATRVGATISRIDASAALLIPGVIAFYTAADIPGVNSFVCETFLYVNDELLAAGTVKYYHQPYGIMVAETHDIANAAAKKVKVTYVSSYTGEKPIFLTTADVLEANAKERICCTFESKMSLSALQISTAPTAVSGRGIFQVGGQYCFTMEPLTTIAVPIEQGMQIYCATQWMDQTQLMIAQLLKVKVNSIQLAVRRLGGAYGFKISSGNKGAGAAALVLHKLQRQVRFVQTIESMMETSGKRYACRSDYEFRVDPNGKIRYMKNTFYHDAGINLNENPFIQHTVGKLARNCYQLDERNSTISANMVLTDAPSSIWVRAPGALEAIAMMENIIEHIAFETNIDPADVRLVNMKTGSKFLQLLPRFLQNNEYRTRRKEIDDFNLKNRWRKRGIGLAIMEFDVNYLGQFQATVAIYHGDGTVVIKHGGIEVGQGLNTKASQVAAYILAIPLDKVKIEASDTINGATSFVTGGSIGSESVCYAVRQACYTLNDRLKPIRDQLGPNATFEAVLKIAYTRNINLVASEHYKTGDLQPYVLYGLALTQLELDVLTGNSQIQRVDICQDTGNSLSPNIDIGQVEGAFTMSLGYWLIEKLIYDRTTGRLVTNRTWNYKVPGALDIPIDFRIELLPGNPNATGFMRSKTCGEPPCCLGVSIIFALQHAVQSVRTDNGLPRKYIRFGAPTTPEDIVLATEINEGMYKLS